MTHYMVTQLKLTRHKWLLAFENVSPEDAVKRIEPMNCISWFIGHLAFHEHHWWVEMGQGRTIAPEVNRFAWGQPASTPPLEEVRALWHRITPEADLFLDSLTQADVDFRQLAWEGKVREENIGMMLLRMTYHYWYHIGESQAVRQMLGHSDLPSFIGKVPPEFQYKPE